MSGPITVDGCPVDLYTRLPARGEPELIHGAIPAGADVLDLGAGTGRIAHGLIALGHPVVAVDQPAEMLAHVRGAETMRSSITGLAAVRGRLRPVARRGARLVRRPPSVASRHRPAVPVQTTATASAAASPRVYTSAGDRSVYTRGKATVGSRSPASRAMINAEVRAYSASTGGRPNIVGAF